MTVPFCPGSKKPRQAHRAHSRPKAANTVMPIHIIITSTSKAVYAYGPAFVPFAIIIYFNNVAKHFFIFFFP
jgi:hypothetical protein